MKKRKKLKIVIFSALALFLVAAAVVIVKSPLGPVLFDSKSHFITHPADERVLYEPGAEDLARQIAAFLPQAVTKVEQGHHLPFSKPFRVYVCADQRSHNRFIGQRGNPYPIRGAAFWGNVYIAPSAFSFKGRDTHKESLVHELSHLHLVQRLGHFKNGKLPHWFKEGIANCIAGSGGEGIGEEEAVTAILAGRHLVPDEEGSLFKSINKAFPGLTGPMFHLQNKMFVAFIQAKDPAKFAKFIVAVQKGAPFAETFQKYYRATVRQTWDDFKAGLT